MLHLKWYLHFQLNTFFCDQKSLLKKFCKKIRMQLILFKWFLTIYYLCLNLWNSFFNIVGNKLYNKFIIFLKETLSLMYIVHILISKMSTNIILYPGVCLMYNVQYICLKMSFNVTYITKSVNTIVWRQWTRNFLAG